MLKISIEAEAKEIAELVQQLQKKSGNEKATKERSGYLGQIDSTTSVGFGYNSPSSGRSSIAGGRYSLDSSNPSC